MTNPREVERKMKMVSEAIPRQAKRSMRHDIRHTMIIMFMTCVGVCFIPIASMAQEQEPLRMVVINASERGGDQPRAQLVEILGSNAAIELIESEDVRRVMEDFGVNEKVLRQQELRARFRTRLMKLAQTQRIEGLLIVDTYNKGRTLQVVVLGPDGEELQDIRRKIKGGRLDQDKAIEVLQEVFPVLGPEVLSFRKREQLAKQNADSDPEPQEPGEGDPVKVEPPREEPVATGYFNRGIDLGVGYFFGQRSLSVSEINNNNPDRINHNTIMSGVGAQLDATAIAFGEQNRSSIAIRGAFAVGFFITTFEEVDNRGQPTKAKFASQAFDVAGELVYRQMLTSKLHLGAFAGAQNIVVKISQTSQPDENTEQVFNNSSYTGTGYVALRLGAEAGFRFSDAVSASVYGGMQPLVSADVSQALGESATTLGAMAGARLKLNFTRNFYVQGVYAFSLFRPAFPNPPGTVAGGEVKIDSEAAGRDLMHNLQAVIGLSF